jgi:hypothetical protein
VERGLERKRHSPREIQKLSNTLRIFATTLRIFDNNKKVNLFIQMSSFKELQKLFLICHDQGIVDDEQLLLFLYCSYDSKKTDFPYELYPDFNLHEMDEDECLAEFRFRKQDILVFAENLQIPQRLLCEQRSICGGLTGLCTSPCNKHDQISFKFLSIPNCIYIRKIQCLFKQTLGYAYLRKTNIAAKKSEFTLTFSQERQNN